MMFYGNAAIFAAAAFASILTNGAVSLAPTV